MLGELTGEEEADGGLHFPGGEGVLLVVADEAGGLGGDLLEDVVDEGVHDGHGLLGDTELGVDLLEDSVDVHREGLATAAAGGGGGLLVGLGGGSGAGSFAGFLSGCHCKVINYKPASGFKALKKFKLNILHLIG